MAATTRHTAHPDGTGRHHVERTGARPVATFFPHLPATEPGRHRADLTNRIARAVTR